MNCIIFKWHYSYPMTCLSLRSCVLKINNVVYEHFAITILGFCKPASSGSIAVFEEYEYNKYDFT